MLEQVLFEDTTTIGVRRSPLWRHALAREEVMIETQFGAVRAKRVVLPDGNERTYPEHDAIAEVAREQRMGYQDVLRNVRGRD